MSRLSGTKPENEVNAYLFYSARLLHLLNSPLLIEHQADKMALTASVCLSLKQAWEAWLKELSAYVGKSIPEYASLFLAENEGHPEVQCLLEVCQQQSSWLPLMLLYFEPRLSKPTEQTNSNDDEHQANGSLTRINALQVNESNDASDEDKLSMIIKEFKHYINAVRSRQAEW